MAKNDTVNRLVRQFALKSAEATPRERWLITHALLDLWHGPRAACPPDDGDDNPDHAWPGYGEAISELSNLDERLPGEAWYDEQSEEVFRSEPEPYKCDACKGTGLDAEDDECEECHGVGTFEVDYSDYRRFDNRDIRQLVFRELVGNGM